MSTKSFQPTVIAGLPSPYDEVGGLVYFSRMIAKIRLHAAGLLPPEYHENRGIGFDGRCVRFLGVEYDALKVEVLRGETSDEVLLEWCFEQGRRPTQEEIEIWNGFLMKRGWRDGSRALLERRIKDAGLGEGELQIETMFDFIDIDEGRPLRYRGAELL